MVKTLQKIGNSRGVVLDRAILSLLNMDEKGAFEIVPKDGGLFLKPVFMKSIYKKLAHRRGKSPDRTAK